MSFYLGILKTRVLVPPSANPDLKHCFVGTVLQKKIWTHRETFCRVCNQSICSESVQIYEMSYVHTKSQTREIFHLRNTLSAKPSNQQNAKYTKLLTNEMLNLGKNYLTTRCLTQDIPGQGFGSVSGSASGSAWIRINLSFWIRIRIQEGKNDPQN